jgi:FkbM family methyltransferase
MALGEITNDSVGNFSRLAINAGALSNQPMVVIDVGASGGLTHRWRPIKTAMRTVSFEPDHAAYSELQKTKSEDSVVLPYALGRRQEVRNFYHAGWFWSSGLYPSREKFWKRFAASDIQTVTKVSQIETIDLKTACLQNGIHSADFIKIDVEGAELDILEGADDFLNTILGAELEVTFSETHEGRCVFADVDTFMRKNGFALFALPTVSQQRRSMPYPDRPPTAINNNCQPIAADALYIRDVIDTETIANYSEVQLLKLIMIYDLYGRPDSALELLELAVERSLVNREYLQFAGNLLPSIFGKTPSLDLWRQLVKLFQNWEK